MFYVAFNDVAFGLNLVSLIILYRHIILTLASFVLPLSVHLTHSLIYYSLNFLGLYKCISPFPVFASSFMLVKKPDSTVQIQFFQLQVGIVVCAQ